MVVYYKSASTIGLGVVGALLMLERRAHFLGDIFFGLQFQQMVTQSACGLLHHAGSLLLLHT